MRNTTVKVGMIVGCIMAGTFIAKAQTTQAAPAAEAIKPETESVKAGFGSVKLNGLLQGWYQYDEGADPKGTFRLRRAEIKLSGDIIPEVAWWLMFDPATVREDTVRSTSIDDASVVTSVGRKSVLQDFAIRLKPVETLSLDVGQYKIPFGMEGLKSSSKLDFIDRAAMFSRFKWGDRRDIGATLRGDFHLGDAAIRPEVGVYNGEGQNRLDANGHKMTVGRLVLNPVTGLHLGAAHANNKVGADETKSAHTGFEAKYEIGPASVYGEYAFGESEGKNRRTYYITATCNVLDDLQLAARYDWFDPDTDKDDDAQTETTVGVNYFIAGNNAKMQLNYVFRGEEGDSINNDVLRANLQVSF